MRPRRARLRQHRAVQHARLASNANQGEEDPVNDLDEGGVRDRRLGHDQVMADKVHRQGADPGAQTGWVELTACDRSLDDERGPARCGAGERPFAQDGGRHPDRVEGVGDQEAQDSDEVSEDLQMRTPGQDDGLDPAFLKLAVILLTGAMVVMFDTTIVNVAINTLSRELNASVSTTQWVISAYVLALAMPAPGRPERGDRRARRPASTPCTPIAPRTPDRSVLEPTRSSWPG